MKTKLSVFVRITIFALDNIASNQDTTAPAGCVNVRLQIDATPEMTHEELPVSLNTDEHGKEIPIALRMYLEKIKKQYLSHIEEMQVRKACHSLSGFGVN